MSLRVLPVLALGLALAIPGALAQIVEEIEEIEAVECPECETCGNTTFGTSIEWQGSASEAATIARAEEKLVFVLHVSGLFEDPDFT